MTNRSFIAAARSTAPPGCWSLAPNVSPNGSTALTAPLASPAASARYSAHSPRRSAEVRALQLPKSTRPTFPPASEMMLPGCGSACMSPSTRIMWPYTSNIGSKQAYAVFLATSLPLLASASSDVRGWPCRRDITIIPGVHRGMTGSGTTMALDTRAMRSRRVAMRRASLEKSHSLGIATCISRTTGSGSKGSTRARNFPILPMFRRSAPMSCCTSAC
mmetsp:Transcript_19692/g.34010  ORF Transcript_19692/g.34010 Transcript_19692/m.34010 type:complete len:218 (-) Transcript_19692:250-903(-)